MGHRRKHRQVHGLGEQPPFPASVRESRLAKLRVARVLIAIGSVVFVAAMVWVVTRFRAPH
jgi:hypothetical protein